MSPRRERPRRLSFYHRLSAAQKREYDRSDVLTKIDLTPHVSLGGATNRVVEALQSGSPRTVREAAQALVERICERVEGRRVPSGCAPRVKVLRTRPRAAGGEFHGLYTRDSTGRSEIKVWMFTAAHREVVRPRTFLRTLLHEMIHHLDMTVLDLPSSFHTMGFHARESSLLHVLERSGGRVPGGRSPAAGSRAARRESPPEPERKKASARVRQATPRRKPSVGGRTRGEQLALFPGD